MKDVARSLRRHCDGIVAWMQSLKTDGFVAAINGLFQAAKRKVRDRTDFSTMRTELFLIAADLTLRIELACRLRAITHFVFRRACFLLMHRWCTAGVAIRFTGELGVGEETSRDKVHLDRQLSFGVSRSTLCTYQGPLIPRAGFK